jgi:hypothetical protein
MLQDLNDLGVPGRMYPGLLGAIRSDMFLLDQAAQTASELSTLLAEVNGLSAGKIRDN